MKYIVVLGGIMSSVGKGITASSIGVLLKYAGYDISIIKIDPYLNCDAGNMSPYEHGEVYVLDDGSQVDLDLGNYERFLDVTLHSQNNITTGKLYNKIIEKEKCGDFLGQTIQIHPHLTDEIQKQFHETSKNSDVCIIELGGTLGDSESIPFLKALSQLAKDDRHQVLFVLVSYIPMIGDQRTIFEQKTKPTQLSVQELRRENINPDMIVCRCATEVHRETLLKIAKSCDLPDQAVFSCEDTNPIHNVPEIFFNQGVMGHILTCFRMSIGNDEKFRDTFLKSWFEKIEPIKRLYSDGFDGKTLNILIVGKYLKKPDTYHSINKSILHASAVFGIKPMIFYTESLEEYLSCDHEKVDGIIVPGGFGSRCFEKKIESILSARKRRIPLLGICMGFQAMLVAFAREVLGEKDANSTEFVKDAPFPIVDRCTMSLSMRVGSHKIIPINDEFREIYKVSHYQDIYERHRNRYGSYYTAEQKDLLESHGLHIYAISDEYTSCGPSSHRDHFIEAVSWPLQNDNKQNVCFMGTQYHPEFQSHPGSPSPIFANFIHSCIMISYGET